jgi:hypothetical protein
MKVRLGYPDRILVVEGDTVYLFKKRLYSAPLEEVVKEVRDGDALLPPAMREVAVDIVSALDSLQKARVYKEGAIRIAMA